MRDRGCVRGIVWGVRAAVLEMGSCHYLQSLLGVGGELAVRLINGLQFFFVIAAGFQDFVYPGGFLDGLRILTKCPPGISLRLRYDSVTLLISPPIRASQLA